MWIEKVRELREQGRTFVLATIIRSQGSTPRGIGTRMIVMGDGSAHGTIGGGEVERAVLNHAPSVLANGQPDILAFSLNGDTWQAGSSLSAGLCGGFLEVLLEPFFQPEELVIFGAGHIGHKLAALCEVMEIPCRVYDNRPEFATQDRFPWARSVIAAPYEEIRNRITLSSSSYCVILTHNHSHDHVVLEALLGQPSIPYIGMIGSRTKTQAIIGKIRESGMKPDHRLYAPVGLNIGRRKPQDIALAILAEIQALISGGSPAHCRLDWTEQDS